MGAAYLGDSGLFELTRTGLGVSIEDVINPGDVNANTDRFSMNFPVGSILTGDKLELKTIDGSLLSFVDPSGWGDGAQYSQGKWFVFVDLVGGIRLYQDFEAATSGERRGSVALLAINRDIPIAYTVSNNNGRLMAQVTSYTFSTNRETADVTSLSDQFRQQYSTLISGSGQLTAFFDYRSTPCRAGSTEETEAAIYLHQLAIRLNLGAAFKARLYLINRGANIDITEKRNDEVWYEIQGVITNVAISFESGVQVKSVMDFVSTGRIMLKVTTTSNYLTQTDGFSRFALESNQRPGYIEVSQEPRID
jgi:hypothetical protein